MRKFALLFAVLYCFPGLSFVPDSYAAIYKYVDKQGIVCFADDLQSVPEKYRSKAVIVEGEAKEDPEKPQSLAINNDNKAEEQSAANAPAETLQIRGPRPLSLRLMISAAVSLAALLIFILLTKQAGLKENKKVHAIIRASLISLVSLYLIIAHVKDVMTIFGIAGKTVNDVQQQSAEKGKRAAQAIKTIDALFEQAQKAQEASHAAAGDDKNK